ncbi:MAG: endo-1,4-beta-xylanase [Trueperaceae bacterium]|nr:endo-1,4-beta-xylanase [Trueperaceae bacterium]
MFGSTDAARKPWHLARRLCTLALALSLFSAALAQGGPPWPESGLAAGKDKFLGNIMRANIHLEFRDHWNQVTPEDSGKWLSVEALRGTMVWTVLDLIYGYARANGLPVKQHTFVWGQQEPRWLPGLSPDEQREEVDEWMRLFAERYPDTAFVDVVNEPVHAPPSYAEALGGDGETGWDWVVWAFERARLHFPDAVLLINEYNVICCAADRAAYIEIARILHERGLIDGIGVQGHGLEQVSAERIVAALDEIAAVGLPIYISELELATSDDEAQLEMYQRVFPALWEHPAVAGVTLWGYRAGQIWRKSAYLLDWFDEERPALTWLREYLEGH